MNRNGKHRLVEAGKNLLILLLALSAFYLLGRTQLFTEAFGASQGWVAELISLFGDGRDGLAAGPTEGNQAAVIHPARIAISNERGRYGAQYNTALVDELYSKMPNLLADALAGADPPRAISEATWKIALTRNVPSVYVDLLGNVPLHVLALSVGGGASTTSLEARTRRLLLTLDADDGVVLYYINEPDGSYYACDITSGQNLASRLSDAVEEYSPNGMLFAFEDPVQYADLAPYTMVRQDTTPAPPAYAASNPVPIYDTDAVDNLLRDLSFHPQSSQAVRSSNVLTIREGSGDSLKLFDTGVAVYHAASVEDSRFSIPVQGADLTQSEAVEAAWSLVAQAAGSRCGDARLYLLGQHEGDLGLTLYFGYQLSGADVLVRQDGYAAKVTIRQNSVVDFTIQLRAYRSASDSPAPILPVTRAVAAMQALEVEGSELLLSYLDEGNGGNTLSAQWVAR